MGRGVKLFRVLGIQISLDYTWFIVFGLVAWSLAQGYFPITIPGLTTFTYILVGIISAALLFACVLIHELSHSYTSNKLGLDVKEITLFIFGGVAHLTKEPEDPITELKIAVAGPAASVALAATFWLLMHLAAAISAEPVLSAVFGYLAMINMVLVVFNLIPGFPLDGGRILRAIWWKKTGDLQKATQVASQVGKGFAVLLIGFGFFQIFMGNFIGGLWMIFIGMFLQQAADSSYKQLLVKKTLETIKVGDAMTRNVVTITEDSTLSTVVEKHFFGYHFVGFPVSSVRQAHDTSDGRITGMLTLNNVRLIPKEQWDTTLARDVMDNISPDAILRPEDNAMDALSRMISLDIGRLLVMDNGKLVGIITRRDIMKLMEFKADLGV
ncbi:MAG: site-2 protease family protein [Deltaproteobacteria bacterium]|nr:site-2 protease family protein [Deltaproteobacteria bacterium]